MRDVGAWEALVLAAAESCLDPGVDKPVVLVLKRFDVVVPKGCVRV